MVRKVKHSGCDDKEGACGKERGKRLVGSCGCRYVTIICQFTIVGHMGCTKT